MLAKTVKILRWLYAMYDKMWPKPEPIDPDDDEAFIWWAIR